MGKPRANDVNDAEIIVCYRETHSAYETSQRLDISTSTIYRVLEAHGIRRDGMLRVYMQSVRPKAGNRYFGSRKLVADLYRSGKSLREIADKIDMSTTTVKRILRDEGVETIPWGAKGDEASNWGGGRIKVNDGYWRMWVADDDPLTDMRDSRGYVLEHRLVLARKLGRPLLRTETVHHIDGDRSNNAPENLQLRHGKHGKHVVLCCRDCGSHNVGPVEVA